MRSNSSSSNGEISARSLIGSAKLVLRSEATHREHSQRSQNSQQKQVRFYFSRAFLDAMETKVQPSEELTSNEVQSWIVAVAKDLGVPEPPSDWGKDWMTGRHFMNASGPELKERYRWKGVPDYIPRVLQQQFKDAVRYSSLSPSSPATPRSQRINADSLTYLKKIRGMRLLYAYVC